MQTIALVGNPNSGKTTQFNALTGAQEPVGNWPGVTVAPKKGPWRQDATVTLIDLPGTYSLTPFSPEEAVTRDVLLGTPPDVILNIVDGTQLERSLFLTSQLTELGIPLVIGITKGKPRRAPHLARQQKALQTAFGCTVCELTPKYTPKQRHELKQTLLAAQHPPSTYPPFAPALRTALAELTELLPKQMQTASQRFFATQLLARSPWVWNKLSPAVRSKADICIAACERTHQQSSEALLIEARYACVQALLPKRQAPHKNTGTQAIDRIATHRWLAWPVLAAVLWMIYALAIGVGAACSTWVSQTLFGAWLPQILEQGLTRIGCSPLLQALLIHGVLRGVGGVLGFVPQMFLLFTLLGALEACGYMARIAFILDPWLRCFGFSGKAIIPILLGSGCGVPGILAARTIESPRERRLSILTTTFIPCSAKLPIIAWFGSTLLPSAWWLIPSLYVMGLACIFGSGWLLQRLPWFQGTPALFLMELPAYALPKAKPLLATVLDRTWGFMQRAGTVIFASSVLLWCAANLGFRQGGLQFVPMEQSLLAALGHSIAWVFAPLGFGQWQSAVAVLTGLLAKEELASTLQILLGSQLRQHFSPAAGLSFLVFNLLCAPCVAALSTMRREFQSNQWFAFALLWQTTLAYAAAALVFWLCQGLQTLGLHF